MINQSVGTEKTWAEDGLIYRELIRQEYTNCSFTAGEVEGHPVDTMYLRLERNGKVDTFLHLREDEAAALAYCLIGVLWSKRLETIPDVPMGN